MRESTRVEKRMVIDACDKERKRLANWVPPVSTDSRYENMVERHTLRKWIAQPEASKQRKKERIDGNVVES